MSSGPLYAASVGERRLCSGAVFGASSRLRPSSLNTESRSSKRSPSPMFQLAGIDRMAQVVEDVLQLPLAFVSIRQRVQGGLDRALRIEVLGSRSGARSGPAATKQPVVEIGLCLVQSARRPEDVWRLSGSLFGIRTRQIAERQVNRPGVVESDPGPGEMAGFSDR